MFDAKKLLVTLGAVIAFSSALADEVAFTSADVLSWNEEDQNILFLNSILMVGIVATQTDESGRTARCIDDWYSDDAIPERQDYIRSVLERFPDHHPQVMILAVIEKECGEFGSG